MATAGEDARLVVALSALGRGAIGATRRLTDGQQSWSMEQGDRLCLRVKR